MVVGPGLVRGRVALFICCCFLMVEREGLWAGLEPEWSSLGLEGLASGRLTPLETWGGQ